MDRLEPNPPPRSAALIVQAGKVLLIERRTSDRPVYYVLPGGGIERGETPEQAARRELQEELGLSITTGRVERDLGQTDRPTWIVHSTISGSATPVWQETHLQSAASHYQAVWLPVTQLPSLELYPVGAAAAAIAVSGQ